MNARYTLSCYTPRGGKNLEPEFFFPSLVMITLIPRGNSTTVLSDRLPRHECQHAPHMSQGRAKGARNPMAGIDQVGVEKKNPSAGKLGILSSCLQIIRLHITVGELGCPGLRVTTTIDNGETMLYNLRLCGWTT